MSRALKTLVIVSLATLFVSIVLYITLFIYTDINIEKTKSITKEVIENRQRSEQAQKIRSVLEDSRELESKMITYFVPDGDVVKSIELIESLAAKNSLEIGISSLNADDSSNLEKFSINKIKAKVDTKGSWKNTVNFLYLIEALPYKSLINNISLRASQDDKKNPIWNLTFSIEIYKIK